MTERSTRTAPTAFEAPGIEAVVSLLDDAHDARVRALWRELEREFGLQGIYGTPYPHFSYCGAQDYDDDAVREALERIALEWEPFSVRTSGLGMFSGERPVLYVPVVRNPRLDSLHARLCGELERVAKDPNPHYEPDRWVPHITLAYGDVTKGVLADVVEYLSDRDFSWSIRVESLALVYAQGVDQGIRTRVALGETPDEPV